MKKMMKTIYQECFRRFQLPSPKSPIFSTSARFSVRLGFRVRVSRLPGDYCSPPALEGGPPAAGRPAGGGGGCGDGEAGCGGSVGLEEGDQAALGQGRRRWWWVRGRPKRY